MTKIKTQNLVLCSLFSAIIAICSWLTIPAAVPFTLQTFAIFAALLVLGGKWGTASICVYILLGAVGLPVFSGFKGGIGVLIGVTGGYILGFILSGLVFWIMEHLLGNSLLTKISAMILGLIICYTAGTAWFVITYTKNMIINMALLILGFACLGKGFGMKTAYVTVLSSVLLNIFEKVVPLSAPLTDQTMLELVYAIVLPAFAAALFFFENASGGGTDILAMILKRHTTLNIATALLVIDAVIVIASFLIYDVKTGLYSVCGLLAKTMVIDKSIEQMKLCKYFTIICRNPEPICDYIKNSLHRTATIYHGQGAYSHEDETIVLSALDRKQAVQLQRFIHRTEPTAFIMITKSSEIIGKGFYGGEE